MRTLNTTQNYSDDIVTKFSGHWTIGDGTNGTDGYCVDEFFDENWLYLGPDKHGIEPLFADADVGEENQHVVIAIDTSSGEEAIYVDGRIQSQHHRCCIEDVVDVANGYAITLTRILMSFPRETSELPGGGYRVPWPEILREDDSRIDLILGYNDWMGSHTSTEERNWIVRISVQELGVVTDTSTVGLFTEDGATDWCKKYLSKANFDQSEEMKVQLKIEQLSSPSL